MRAVTMGLMDALMNAMVRALGRATATRFCQKIEVKESGCWQWTAGTSRGYGLFHLGNGMHSAHRLAYVHVKGPVPEGLVLDHWACDNKGCVNPDHLRPVTQQENILRARTVNPAVPLKSECLRGHAFTEANTLWLEGRTGRQCRACNALRSRSYRDRKRALQ